MTDAERSPSRETYITVYFDSQILKLHVDIAKALNYRGGEQLSREQAWEALGANVNYSIRRLKKKMAALKGNPDV